jgi:hypothetical protein
MLQELKVQGNTDTIGRQVCLPLFFAAQVYPSFSATTRMHTVAHFLSVRVFSHHPGVLLVQIVLHFLQRQPMRCVLLEYLYFAYDYMTVNYGVNYPFYRLYPSSRAIPPHHPVQGPHRHTVPRHHTRPRSGPGCFSQTGGGCRCFLETPRRHSSLFYMEFKLVDYYMDFRVCFAFVALRKSD